MGTHIGNACAVTARLRPQAAVERRRSALLATTALAILAAAMASPRSALAQSCSTSGTDPVTITCNAPGATITTVGGTGNTTSPNPATNASTQQFNADLIGNVTATTTVLGFGLNLVTVKANGGIAMTNNGQVTRFQLGSPALFLNGNGGAVTYNGAGFISSTGDALRLGNRSNGAISATIDGSATASGPNAAAVSAQNLGSGTVLVTGGGSVLGTSAGISATSNSGNVTVSGSGDSIASGPNGDGIAISSTSGNVLVNRTGTASGAFGINALAGGNGNITITGIGEAIGTGAVFGVAGTGIATSAAAGTTTIATTHNVTGGLVGIGAFASSGGTINVTTGGTVTGGFAAVVLNSSANNTLVNSGAIVNSSGLAGLAIEAFAGNNAVTNSGLVAGAVDLGPGANAFNNLAGGAFLAGSSVKLGAGNTLSNAGTFSPGGPSVMTTALTGNYVQSATGI